MTSEFKAGIESAGARRAIRRTLSAVVIASTAIMATASADAASRIKDIADFEGIRDNLLIGYGLVVGLNGTGDDLDDAVFTKQSLVGMLERLGVNVRGENLDVDNVAAVMVTATLPSFSRQGTRIDVTASALGTSDSLLGGTLLVTPLLGADGEVYAVAQGQLAVGGFQIEGAAQSVSKGVPTSGRIANGAIIERELQFELGSLEQFKVALRNPDLTTARRVASAINTFVGETAATAIDPSTVILNIPADYNGNGIDLLTDIEQLKVEPDQIARVIIDEQTGTIVMGDNVRISTVAIAQGNLTVRITETPQVSQPNPFAPDSATTEIVDRTQIDIDEGQARQLAVVSEGVSIHELVNGLNALGIGPRDMISILQAVKAAGAMQADLEVL